MRIKRNKGFRRTLRYYRLHYKILEPYKILVDGPFVQEALQGKLDVREQLTKLVSGGRITPCTTSCILHELRNLGQKGEAALWIAQTFYKVKCGHSDPLSAADCVQDQIGAENERRLIVATQDLDLAAHLRNVPGVPLIRFNHYTPLLEDPSAASRTLSGKLDKKAVEVGEWERKKLPMLAQKEAIAAARAAQPPPNKRWKGPKGPNPLSCMKSKKDAPAKKRKKTPARSAIMDDAAASPEISSQQRTRPRIRGPRECTTIVDTAESTPAGARPASNAVEANEAHSVVCTSRRVKKRRRLLRPT